MTEKTYTVTSEELAEDFMQRYPDLERVMIQMEFPPGETYTLPEVAAIKNELEEKVFGDDGWINYLKCFAATLVLPLTMVLSFSDTLLKHSMILRGMRSLIRYLSPSWLLSMHRALYFMIIVPFSTSLFVLTIGLPLLYIITPTQDSTVTLTEGVYPSMLGVAVFFMLLFLMYEKRSSLYKAVSAYLAMHDTFHNDSGEIAHAADFFDIVFERDIRAKNDAWARRKFIMALLLPIPSTAAPVILRMFLGYAPWGETSGQRLIIILAMIVSYCCTYFITLLFGESVRLYNTFYVYSLAFSKWTKRDVSVYATIPSNIKRKRDSTKVREEMMLARSLSSARGTLTYFNLVEPSGLLFWSRARHDLQNRQLTKSYEMAVFLSFMIVCLIMLVVTEMVQLYVESESDGKYAVSSALFTMIVAYDCLLVGLFLAVLLITGVIINKQTDVVTKSLSSLNMDISWAKSGALPQDKLNSHPESLVNMHETIVSLISLLDREKDEFGLRVLGITINSAFTSIIISIASAALVPFVSSSAMKLAEVYA